MKLGIPAPFGWRGLAFGATSAPYSPANRHRGQDWGFYNRDVWGSSRVVAGVDGVVTSVYKGGGWNSGWGNRVEITLAPRVVYALNHFGHIAVSLGQPVAPDRYLGQMGDTGDTQGVHLHEELWIDGVRVDPHYYRLFDIPGTPATAGETPAPFPIPTPAVPEEEDDMRTVVLIRTTTTNGAYDGDWTISTPSDGLDLPIFDGTNGPAARRLVHSGDDGVIYQYRGFRSTNIQKVGEQWRRMFGYPSGLPHARLAREEYIVAQAQLSQLAGTA